MARPSPEARAKIEERRQHWAGVREREAAAREAINLRVKSLSDAALLKPADEPPTMAEVTDKLRRAFTLAMETSQPAPAIAAAMALAKLGGLVVERAAIVQGSPDEFRTDAEKRQRLLDRVTEKYGVEGARRLERVVKEIRERYGPRGRVIEGEADDGE